MSRNGSLFQESHRLEPPSPSSQYRSLVQHHQQEHGEQAKRKSEVNFRDTIVTFKPNGNISSAGKMLHFQQFSTVWCSQMAQSFIIADSENDSVINSPESI